MPPTTRSRSALQTPYTTSTPARVEDIASAYCLPSPPPSQATPDASPSPILGTPSPIVGDLSCFMASPQGSPCPSPPGRRDAMLVDDAESHVVTDTQSVLSRMVESRSASKVVSKSKSRSRSKRSRSKTSPKPKFPAKPEETKDDEDMDAEDEPAASGLACTLPSRPHCEATRDANMLQPFTPLAAVHPESVIKFTILVRRKHLDESYYFPWDSRAILMDMEEMGLKDVTTSSWQGWLSERVVYDVVEVPEGGSLRDIPV